MQILEGSLLHNNSVLELILKIIGVIAVILLLKSVLVSLSDHLMPQIASIQAGCDAPPHTVIDRPIPKTPLPMPPGKKPTDNETLEWFAEENLILKQEIAVHNLDRKELRRRGCGR